MNKLIFFDTETTGNTDKDFLCQLAYKAEEESFVGFYRPEKKIPPEASAVHHITNKMVDHLLSFKESDDLPKIKKLFEDKDSVVVAHNAPFDLLMIKKEGIEPQRFICTLRLGRYLDPEEKIERYNLQYLRYLLEIEIDATAHDALGDVLVLEQLYERLYKKMQEEIKKDPLALKGTPYRSGTPFTSNDAQGLALGAPTPSSPPSQAGEDPVIQKMIEISSHPSLLHTFKFGKYNGKRIEEVVKTDRGYLQWLLEQKLNGDGIDEDWIYTLKHYLGK